MFSNSSETDYAESSEQEEERLAKYTWSAHIGGKQNTRAMKTRAGELSTDEHVYEGEVLSKETLDDDKGECLDMETRDDDVHVEGEIPSEEIRDDALHVIEGEILSKETRDEAVHVDEGENTIRSMETRGDITIYERVAKELII